MLSLLLITPSFIIATAACCTGDIFLVPGLFISAPSSIKALADSKFPDFIAAIK